MTFSTLTERLAFINNQGMDAMRQQAFYHNIQLYLG